MDGTQCWGLTSSPSATSASACQAACCDDPTCVLWQFCADPSSCDVTTGGCWLGGSFSYCKPVPGWTGRSRTLPTSVNLAKSSLPLNTTVIPPHNPITASGVDPIVITPSFVAKQSSSSSSSSSSLTPLFPVSCSLHYTRVPAEEWESSIARMVAGGCTFLQTYVFWIHHEETYGVWDWTGRRHLRAFLQLCQKYGLVVMLRMGPWSHGECRGGGFPDWLEALGKNGTVHLRSTDPKYLAYVKTLYTQVQEQVAGLWYTEGGPVLYAQVDNENSDDAYLLALKAMGQELGMRPSYYVRTGWPTGTSPYPYDALVPFFGGYVATFWSSSLKPAPPSGLFVFGDGWGVDGGWPHMGVEMGGGMETAYHRRPVVVPDDVSADILVQVGSGFQSTGYYVYRGGTNPLGLTHLNEEQSSGGAQDLPVRSYDYAAPMSEFGVTRAHYHRLRLLHLFLTQFADKVATWSPALPMAMPSGPSDVLTPRLSVRSDGYGSGFIFLNNHQRGATMQPQTGLRVNMTTAAHTSIFVPDAASPSLSLGTGDFLVLPFGVDVDGVGVAYATAQLVFSVPSGPSSSVAFFGAMAVHANAGMVELVLNASTVASYNSSSSSGTVTKRGDTLVWRGSPSSSTPAVTAVTPSGHSVSFMILSPSDAMSLFRVSAFGQDTAVLVLDDSTADVMVSVTDGVTFRSFNEAASSLLVGSVPPLPNAPSPSSSGVWSMSSLTLPSPPAWTPVVTQTAKAGPPRTIPIARVAEAPTDADFNVSARWTLTLPTTAPPAGCAPFLNLSYVGDVARLYLNGTLLTDDQYTGREMFVGLDRYPTLFGPGAPLLTVEVLPYQDNEPVYIPGPSPPTTPAINSATIQWARSVSVAPPSA